MVTRLFHSSSLECAASVRGVFFISLNYDVSCDFFVFIDSRLRGLLLFGLLIR
jgi:hypothetical protein